MTYEQVAGMTQVVALIFFILLFAGVVTYAFWPGNKRRFERDAKIPFEKDPNQDNDDG